MRDDRKRGQYQSVEMMKMLAQQVPADALRILAVTEVDLTLPMLTFVFGQAQIEGRVAIVSLCRLHQEFYDLPPDEGLLRERAGKEVLHELGHTFGLTHCADMKCAMSLATHVGRWMPRKSNIAVAADCTGPAAPGAGRHRAEWTERRRTSDRHG